MQIVGKHAIFDAYPTHLSTDNPNNIAFNKKMEKNQLTLT
jgi:hypothetical protein